MNIDIHAHFVPADSLKIASEIGKRHGMKLDKNERRREIVTRAGKPYLTQPKAEFSDLDLRLSIMDSQGVDMQAISPASSYFFLLDGRGRIIGIRAVAQRPLGRGGG